MRIMHGALTFFDIKAGIAIEMAPGILLPKPPPVYSLISTMSFGSTPVHRASEPTVWTVLCVEPWRYSLPFCQ
jgi:hypothetical protein